MRALSIASTGMQAQQTNVEVIANNLANMNTTAFKEQRAEFTDLLYQNIQTPGADLRPGHLCAQRHPARRRRAHRRSLPHHHPGRSAVHQQSL
jgi:flagellar basal body rod protein FlgG